MTLRLSFIILSALTIVSCYDALGHRDHEFVSSTGTVRFIGVEGGFYGIVDDEGNRYDPVHLDAAYRRDGLRVIFSGNTDVEIASIHMWGDVIHLTDIRIMPR